MKESDDDESETEDEEESSDNENTEDESFENQSSDEAEEKSSKQLTENFKNNQIIKQVSFSEINNIKRFGEEDETDEEENIHIYIQHTPSENPTVNAINEINEIQSPSDLYVYHKNKFTPKSILKVKSSEKINELVTLNNDNFTEQQFDNNIETYQRKTCPITVSLFL